MTVRRRWIDLALMLVVLAVAIAISVVLDGWHWGLLVPIIVSPALWALSRWRTWCGPRSDAS